MKQIKTIAMANSAKDFDAAVNAAIAEGYTLIRRYAKILPGATTFADKLVEPVAAYYAELELEDKPAPRKKAAKE